jgi:hypothetical protein
MRVWYVCLHLARLVVQDSTERGIVPMFDVMYPFTLLSPDSRAGLGSFVEGFAHHTSPDAGRSYLLVHNNRVSVKLLP